MANKSPTHYLCTVKLSLLYLYKFLRYKNFKNKLFCGTPCRIHLQKRYSHPKNDTNSTESSNYLNDGDVKNNEPNDDSDDEVGNN